MEEYLDDQEMFDLINPAFPEIYSSSQPLISCQEPQTSDDDDGVKQLMMNMSSIIWESTSHNSPQEIITTKPSSSSSSSSSAAAPAQHIISFENSYLPPDSDILTNNFNNINTATPIANDCTSLSSQIIDFSSSSAKHDPITANGVSYKIRDFTATRTPSQAHEHLMAERKHREHLRQLFISLSKVVPGLKKLDKASLLEDATNYLKSLEERVTILEEEDKKSAPINAPKYDCCSSSSYMEKRSIDENASELLAVPEIKARISGRRVLINICCKKETGLMSRIPCEMEKMHLSVLDMRMMPFGGAALDITILAETQSELQGSTVVKGIVDHLQRVLLNIDDDDDIDDNTTKSGC